MLDLMMPVVNGLEVLSYLQREAPEEASKCVIVLSAVAERELLLVHGKPIRSIVRKPFDLDALVATVRECIEENLT